jgi:hypothetical protein
VVLVLWCCDDDYFILDLDAGGTVSRAQPRRQLLLQLSIELTVSYTPPLSLSVYSL